MEIKFPPDLPLPNDPNAANGTYTLYACIDSGDTVSCDGPAFVQPIGQDYQNTLNSNAAHFAFDTVETQSFRGEQSCFQNAADCTPECTFSLPNVQSDQTILTSVGICPNIY